MKRQLLFLALLCVCATPAALAHSSLERSDPKDGATLPQSPNEIKMWFTEPIKVQLSTVKVRDASGKEIDGQDLHADKKQPALVHLSVSANLGPGVYKVSWSAVAQDLHVSKGSFSFRVAAE